MPSRPKQFRPHGVPSPQRAERDYELQRGSARERGYTAAWDKAAFAFKMDHPLCLGCEAIGRTVATQVVDHRIPHRGDMVLFWDPNNWQPGCCWHHAVVKQLLELQFKQGKLKADDLHFDSAVAIALSSELLGLE